MEIKYEIQSHEIGVGFRNRVGGWMSPPRLRELFHLSKQFLQHTVLRPSTREPRYFVTVAPR